jgi:ABC-type spermidine/putrescine transport system permease subunit I
MTSVDATQVGARSGGPGFLHGGLVGKLFTYWPIYPVLIFLGLFFLYPVTLLLGLSFLDQEGATSFDHYTRLFSTTTYTKVLLITLKTAAWTTLLAILAGYPVAYLLATVSNSQKNTLIIWVLMPFWTSFLVRTFAWIVLLGRRGAVNQWLEALGLVDQPIQMIFNFTGVMIGMVHALMPLCILTMLSVMENIDRNLVKAASTLGARGGQAFWRIYFPLSIPGVAAGGMLVFITALGFFITPALLGGARDTMIVQVIIFQIQEILNWGFAGAVAVLLLVAVLIIFFFYDRLLGLSTLSGQGGGSGVRKKNLLATLGKRLGGLFTGAMAVICEHAGRIYDRIVPRHANKPSLHLSRQSLWVIGLTVIAFLALPAIFVIPVSFTEAGFLSWPPQGFDTKWYTGIFETDVWVNAAFRSFIVATLAAFFGMCLGVPAAFFLVRQRFFGKSALFAFLVAPIIIPNIIIAVSLFYLYSRMGIVGTTIGLVFGHTVLAIPYVVITVMAVIKNYDVRLDQAAWTLGANKVKTLWLITFPVVRAGMIAAFMFAFIISFDELTIALFVTGGEVTTLPKQMWDDALLRVSPTLAAIATLLLLFMSGVILTSEILRRRGAK